MTSTFGSIVDPASGTKQGGHQDSPGSSTFSVTSINIGSRVEVEIFGRIAFTAFEKHPVDQVVQLDQHGIVGDGHYGREGQEGLDHAVQICCTDNHAYWSDRLNKALEPGAFGESITYDGPGERVLRIGDVLLVGPVRLQITSARLPCAKLAHFLKQDRSFVQQYHAALRTGILARVLSPGRIAARDMIRIVASDASLPFVAESAAVLLERAPDPKWLRSLADDPRVSIMLRTMYRKKANAIEMRQANEAAKH